MLVDSGSSHCFISEELACRLSGARRAIKHVQVRVANGGVLQCVQEYPHCRWEIQSHIFSTTFRVLPLSCYDIILDMDWLEQCSPMTVHWLKKLMSFWYQGRRVCLQGIRTELNQCCLVWQ